MEAARLLSPLPDGSPWWRPASRDDIGRTPARVLVLFQAMRRGLEAPHVGWWRTAGTRRHAHAFPPGWSGVPESAAACGVVPGDDEWERTDGRFRCPACAGRGGVTITPMVDGRPGEIPHGA